jgi:hypothetical protein
MSMKMDMEQEIMRRDLQILRSQFRCLLRHLELVVERDYSQIGPDDCVSVWKFRPTCEKCRK